jgi:hypothetical protein
MDKIYLIFGVVIILIMCFLFQKSENFVVKDKEKCINNCKSKEWNNYDDLNNCIQKCYE